MHTCFKPSIIKKEKKTNKQTKKETVEKKEKRKISIATKNINAYLTFTNKCITIPVTKKKHEQNPTIHAITYIFAYHFHTNHVNELGNIFPFVIFWVDIYLYAPFSTSLSTLLRSSKVEKLLISICPIILLFTSFTLPSTDKFAVKHVQLPRHFASLSSLFFFLRILVKTFLGERKQPGALHIVLIISLTFFL